MAVSEGHRILPTTDRLQRAQYREIRTGGRIARERINIHHFQGVIVGGLGEFPVAGLENPLFLAENTKFIKDMRPAA